MEPIDPIQKMIQNERNQNFENEYNQYLKHLDPVLCNYWPPYIKTIVEGKQEPHHNYKFKPTSTLKPYRQLEHFNTLTPHNPISLEMMTEYLSQKQYPLVKRIRNCGVFINQNTLTYSYDSFLKSVKIEIAKKDNHIHFNQKIINQYDAQGQILQVINFGEEEAVMIRQLYKITILKQNEVKYKYFTNTEITNSVPNYFNQNELNLTTYNGKQNSSTVTVYRPTVQASIMSIELQNYVISLDQIDRSSLMLATYDTLSILDIRTKTPNQFYKQKQKAERRILDLTWARSELQNTPYFIVGNSTFVQIYDIRNNSSSVGEHRHYCQQSPPINYHIFQSNQSPSSVQNLFKRKHPSQSSSSSMIIIGNSPNKFGNSILLPFPKDLFSSQITCDRYMAGLSSGKRYFANKHPINMIYNYSNQSTNQKSLSIVPYFFENNLFLFHSNNLGTLKVQCLHNNQRVKLTQDIENSSTKPKLSISERNRFLQPVRVKEEDQNQNQKYIPKINYATYRCISDSNLRQFKQQLYNKNKLQDLNMNVFKQYEPQVLKPNLIFSEGMIDDEFCQMCEEEW